MEKTKSTDANSMGMCNKLFSAFNPIAMRPLRRLPFRRTETEPVADTPSISPPNHHPSANGKKDHVPVTEKQPSPPAKPVPLSTPPQKKSTHTPDPHILPKPLVPTVKAETVALAYEKPKPKVSAPAPTLTPAPAPAPPLLKDEMPKPQPRAPAQAPPLLKSEMPKPQPPAPTPVPPLLKNKMPKPQPPAPTAPAPPRIPLSTMPKPQPPAAAPLPEKPKWTINDKVDDYISRARAKLRAGSSDGKAPPS